MATKDFAQSLKTTIEGIKADGTNSIECDNLIAFLDQVITSPQPDEHEQYRQDLARHAEMKHASDLEMFKSVIDAGQNAIKGSMLLNGGAAIAMLAFIGNLADKDAARAMHFASTIVPFAVGALFAGMLSGATYLSQWLYAHEKTEKAGFVMNLVCIALGLASYGTFIWGLAEAYDKISGGLPQ